MKERNLSPQQMFIRLAEEHVPRFRFTGTRVEDFKAWKEAALPLVRATLGAPPERVPLDPELQVEWVHDGLLKQRWIIDVSPHISAVLQVNFPSEGSPHEGSPQGGSRKGKLPAILCWHGHFFGGKETVMGNDSSPRLAQIASAHNCSYGHAMAKAGFVTFGLDWFGYGDRNDSDKPNWRSAPEGKDWKSNLNPKSLETLSGCKLEPSLAGTKPRDRFQFERLGYFCVDPDTQEGIRGQGSGVGEKTKLVFNRTATLRDEWARLQKKS